MAGLKKKGLKTSNANLRKKVKGSKKNLRRLWIVSRRMLSTRTLNSKKRGHKGNKMLFKFDANH